jgi:hypothetical protein
MVLSAAFARSLTACAWRSWSGANGGGPRPPPQAGAAHTERRLLTSAAGGRAVDDAEERADGEGDAVRQPGSEEGQADTASPWCAAPGPPWVPR